MTCLNDKKTQTDRVKYRGHVFTTLTVSLNIPESIADLKRCFQTGIIFHEFDYIS